MIPSRNKDLLIQFLEKGATIQEACKAAQISKPTLYSLFKSNPDYRKAADEAIFKAKDKTQEVIKDIQKRNMDMVKQMIIKRKR